MVDALCVELERHGLAAQVFTNLDEITAAARDAHAAGRLRAVVAAGGDGTLAELVNRTPADTPLAVFPLGTANLMAGYLGLDARPDRFASMLAAGRSIRLDAALGRVAAPPHSASSLKSQASNLSPAARVFLIMAGVGFDAAVVDRLHSRRSGHIRMWNYAKPIWDCVRNYQYPPLRCECALADRDAPAATVAFDARWLFVQNLPSYAGGLQFAPHANPRDGLLDVCAFERGGCWHGLRYLAFALAGGQRRLKDCRMLRVARIRVEANGSAGVQFDGDPAGQLPLEIESLPARARMLVPEGAALRLET